MATTKKGRITEEEARELIAPLTEEEKIMLLARLHAILDSQESA